MSSPADPSATVPSDAGLRAARLARVAVAAASLGLVVLAVLGYPVAPALLAAFLLLYGAVLWRAPYAWLVMLPALFPSFDLAPWTGWLAVEESDLVALVTIAVLTIRAPPRRSDFALAGLPRAAVALAIVAAAVGLVRGLAVPGVPGGSDLIYLEPQNAFRVTKGFLIALALLPFLRRASAERADAPRLFAAGMVAGLALVSAAAIVERAVFTGLMDFARPYRIVATFSSMHLGGGYVGVYAAMALPFALAFAAWRGLPRLAAAAVTAGAIYTLVVTFARAAYGSAVVASAVLASGWIALWRKGARSLPLVLPAALIVAGVAVIALAALDARFMEYRLATAAPDMAWREALWRDGLAVREPGLAAALLGSGSGSFARRLRATLPPQDRAGNFVLREDGGRRVLALAGGLPLYITQRVPIAPPHEDHLSFALRSPDDGTVGVALCENMMLYSTNCRSTEATAPADGTWGRFAATIDTAGMGRIVRLGVLRRPVELSLYVTEPGRHVELADIALADSAGREVLANGDFSRGLARWFYSDDYHTVWRIENQYLMTFFEGGALGLAAFLLVAVAGLRGATRALARGDMMAPAFAASLAAFLASALFDCPLDVPRLSALFYLTAFAAMGMGENTRA
jgi:hypothetical protein